MNWLEPAEVQAWIGNRACGCKTLNTTYCPSCRDDADHVLGEFVRAIGAVDVHAADDVYVQIVEVASLLVKGMDGET